MQGWSEPWCLWRQRDKRILLLLICARKMFQLPAFTGKRCPGPDQVIALFAPVNHSLMYLRECFVFFFFLNWAFSTARCRRQFATCVARAKRKVDEESYCFRDEWTDKFNVHSLIGQFKTSVTYMLRKCDINIAAFCFLTMFIFLLEV